MNTSSCGTQRYSTHCSSHAWQPPCVHARVSAKLRCSRPGGKHASVKVPSIIVTAAGTHVQEPKSDEQQTQRILYEVTKRIQDLGARGLVREAIQELASLAGQGVQPDAHAATTLVRACCKNMELAQGVFDELFGGFLAPDEVAFAVLLRGYGCKSPPDWLRMDATLTAMRVNHGIMPTAISYNVLLETCCRTNDVGRGQDVIDRMEADGVEPDYRTEVVVSKRRAIRNYARKVLQAAASGDD